MAGSSEAPLPGADLRNGDLHNADLPKIDPVVIRRARRVLEPLARYHRFSLVGAEHIPRSGPAMLVVHHSFATYDGFLLGGAVWELTGRAPVGLGDDRIFQTPGLSRIASALGIVPASPEAGERVLRAGGLLAVAPGGMWESLRPRSERRRSRWEGRRGFVRLALRCGAPLVIAACPAADEVYTLYGNPVTDALYRRLHLPFPLARGLGVSVIPRPVRLTGYIARPVVPPRHDPSTEDAQVEALHAEAARTMAELLAR